jgi:hypothetical protein
VSAQNITHSSVLHPIEALRGVHLSIPSSRNKAIALQAPASHEDEDPERSVAETETRRQRLAVRSDQSVDFVDVAVVHLAESYGEFDVAACQFFEGLGDAHPEQAAEGCVARDASLAVAKNVNGAHVSDLAVGGCELLHHRGVVIIGDCTRVVDAEGVEGVGEGCSGFDGVERFLEDDIFGWDGIDVLPTDGSEEGDVVW